MLGHRAFDALLMDRHMAGIDGIETTRRIRARELLTAARRTPTVVLAAEALHRRARRASRPGPLDVPAEPFTFASLLAAPQRLFAATAASNRAATATDS